MFVDACAIVAIMHRETTGPVYERALIAADSPFTSPLAAWEAVLILAHPNKLNCSYRQAEKVVRAWLERQRIELRDADASSVLTSAVMAAELYGVSRRQLSNFDCFHYAQAKAAGVPLLTLDQRLRETDVETLPRTA